MCKGKCGKRNRNRCRCNDHCDKKDKCKKIVVGFIDTVDGTLSSTQVYIDRAMASGTFPNVARVEYALIPAFTGDIRAQANLVEAAVASLYDKGCRYIEFGLLSTYMAPWTTGDAVLTNFGGLNEQQRFPNSDIFFGYGQLGATSVYIDLLLTNCTSQTDSSTPELPIAQSAITQYTNGGTGTVYFVYQFGDAASFSTLSGFQEAAATLTPPVNFVAQAINFDFTSDIANIVVPYSNANLGPNDVVMFAATAQDNLTLAINTAPAITSGTPLFGANYIPATIPLIYDLFTSNSSVFPYYSPFLISLGYSNSPTFPVTDTTQIETLGYFNAMACGKSWAGTDGTAHYNGFKDFIDPLITNFVYRAGTFTAVVLSGTVNPVWQQTNNTTDALAI